MDRAVTPADWIGGVLFGLAILIALLWTVAAWKTGALAERRRVATRLRDLPISQEEFDYLHAKLGLHRNPFDRRTPGEEGTPS